jgi:hypothetical protein
MGFQKSKQRSKDIVVTMFLLQHQKCVWVPFISTWVRSRSVRTVLSFVIQFSTDMTTSQRPKHIVKIKYVTKRYCMYVQGVLYIHLSTCKTHLQVLIICRNTRGSQTTTNFLISTTVELKGALQSFFSRKATLSRGLHRDSFGCILHAVFMSMSTSAHRKTHAC